ncbi:hypothetical protein MARINON1_40093 [Marinobacter salarius]|nr:hypothetical protein MBHK15_111225 [Marinobacter salarius]VXB17454.1 hypothetical protein MARINON1_40093 [Marinobacter salarius]
MWGLSKNASRRPCAAWSPPSMAPHIFESPHTLPCDRIAEFDYLKGLVRLSVRDDSRFATALH